MDPFSFQRFFCIMLVWKSSQNVTLINHSFYIEIEWQRSQFDKTETSQDLLKLKESKPQSKL